MKKALFIVSIIIVISLSIISCESGRGKYKLLLVDIDGVEVADLDPQKISSVHLRLSQIAENIRVIKLQTSDSSLVSNQSVFAIGDKYILVKFLDEIYQFSKTGDFIRLLARKGRGPGEIPSVGNNIQYGMDEKSDLFFVSVSDKIYLYRLSDGVFLGTRALQCIGEKAEARSVVLTADSMFLYSYYSRGGLPDDSLTCGIALQDWNNNVVWNKNFNFKTWTVYPDPFNIELLHGSSISLVKTEDPKEYVVHIDNQESSYSFRTDDFSLKPYLLLRTKGPLKREYPVDLISVGSYRISEEYNRSNGYHLMAMDIVTSLAGFPETIDGYSYQIIYDNKRKEAFNIDPFENDYFGFVHKRGGPTRNLSILPSLSAPYGKVLVVYDASQFLSLARETLQKPDLSKEIRERLLGLSNNLTELSNPVLVIGDMKEKFTLE